MHPEGNWRGNRPGVTVPKGADAVELGAAGGERVTFSAGSWQVDGFSKKLEHVTLTAEPTRFRVLSKPGVLVVLGLAWAASDPGPRAMTLHVADVRWSDAPPENDNGRGVLQ